jgi:hypothetical protein
VGPRSRTGRYAVHLQGVIAAAGIDDAWVLGRHDAVRVSKNAFERELSTSGVVEVGFIGQHGTRWVVRRGSEQLIRGEWAKN